jgi:hypothetical protein
MKLSQFLLSHHRRRRVNVPRHHHRPSQDGKAQGTFQQYDLFLGK